METVTGAMETVGLEPRISAISLEDSQWRIKTNLPDMQKLWNKLQMNQLISTEWVIAPKADHLLNSCEGILQKVMGALSQRGLRATTVMCFISSRTPEYCKTWTDFGHDIRQHWISHTVVLDNCLVGGAMSRKTHMIVSSNRTTMELFSRIVGKTSSHPGSMKPFLDPPNSKYDDYISSSSVSDPPNQSFGTAKVTRIATILDHTNTISRSVFDPDHPAPDIATENCTQQHQELH
jgi:hypothetical protein